MLSQIREGSRMWLRSCSFFAGGMEQTTTEQHLLESLRCLFLASGYFDCVEEWATGGLWIEIDGRRARVSVFEASDLWHVRLQFPTNWGEWLFPPSSFLTAHSWRIDAFMVSDIVVEIEERYELVYERTHCEISGWPLGTPRWLRRISSM